MQHNIWDWELGITEDAKCQDGHQKYGTTLRRQQNKKKYDSAIENNATIMRVQGRRAMSGNGNAIK